MKTFTRFVCEVCGQDYPLEQFARWCESSPDLPDCPVKVGDPVRVYERYDEPQPDVVEAIGVFSLLGRGFFDGWSEAHGADAYAKWRDQVGDAYDPARGDRYGARNHAYFVTVKGYHQMSKDDEGTNEVRLDALAVDGVWLEGMYAGKRIGEEHRS